MQIGKTKIRLSKLGTSSYFFPPLGCLRAFAMGKYAHGLGGYGFKVLGDYCLWLLAIDLYTRPIMAMTMAIGYWLRIFTSWILVVSLCY